MGLKREDFRITLHADPEARTLTVSDNGIGMSEEELENNLGVIASSGTYQFRQEAGKDNALNSFFAMVFLFLPFKRGRVWRPLVFSRLS